MTKHSRNNTASSVFTYAEYKKLDVHYGTKKQRLGAESMRAFDACSLCLQRARDPMACSQGHLYCKECVYNDLLSQRKDIKRHQAKLEAMAREEEEEKQRAREMARERVLLDFEKNQLGLAAKRATITASGEASSSSTAVDAPRGTKRKFEFDQDTVDKLALEAEEAALRQIEVEQAEARRAKLPDFWLPSLTPTSKPGPLKDIKLQCLCHQSTPSHPMSLKGLIPVKFTFITTTDASSASSTPTGPAPSSSSSSTASKAPTKAICPSCKKELSNSTNLTLLRTCSHVVCKTCCDTLVRPSGSSPPYQCSVCDEALPKAKDIIDIEREGTGYSAGGRAEATRAGVAFQG